MRKRAARLSLAALLFVCAQGSAAQDLPEWRLADRPSAQVGHDGSVDLHRVTSGAALPAGQFVVADAGNYRLLILAPTGRVLREFGREGRGPGEFRSISRVFSVADTIIAYDGGLGRLTLWDGNGNLLGTWAVPSYHDRPLDIWGAVSSSEFVATTREPGAIERRGVYADTLTLVRLSTESSRVIEHARVQWRYLYQYWQGEGTSTTYLLPFFGSAEAAVVGDIAAVTSPWTAEVVLHGPGGSRSRVVRLPVRLPPFERAAVARYRDSILARARGAAVERIRKVYGDELKPIRNGPGLHGTVASRTEVWVESSLTDPRGNRTWYVVDPTRAKPVATLHVPQRSRVLAFTQNRVLLLRTSDLGVETLAIVELEK